MTASSFEDYAKYVFSRQEWMRVIGQYVLLDAAVSYLFFCSWIAFPILLPGIVLFQGEKRKEWQKRRQDRMKQQFLDGIQLMSASLQAGYSAENALRETAKELKKVYGAEACVVKEFQHINTQVAMNRNIEELLLDFGRRSGIEEIRSFAEVFLTARRTGGDLLCIIRNTVFCIRQKMETVQEIETCLSGKKMEQNIMSLIPLLILAYVKLTSPEFIASMYGNPVGVIVMGTCLFVYVLAYFWGKRIVQIEV